MKLIDTYISEVGRRLPKKNRADIEAEIRSTLEDMLEERGRKAGKPVDDELVVEVLREFGAPEKVAASYQGERYLISPQLFPTFLLVLKIVLSVFGTLALIGLGVQLARSGVTFMNVLDGIAGVGSAFIVRRAPVSRRRLQAKRRPGTHARWKRSPLPIR
jgi:HAAS